MTDHGFDFHTLTPDVQLNAIESVGIYPQSGLLALNSYENRVAQFVADDGQRYVVKFYRPGRRSNAQILEEHAFCHELAQADIPVVAPIYREGTSLFTAEGFRFALFPSVGGRGFEVDNWDQLKAVGRYLGRLHQVGAATPFQERAKFDLDSHLYQPRQVLNEANLIPEGIQATFFSDLDRLIDAIAARWHTDWPAIRLHGDCHPSNILWRDGPLFVDFDDTRNGPAIQDLWLFLNGSRADQLAQLDTLAEGYREFREFPADQLQLIEPLRGLRMVHYMAWLAKRWQDPAFPRAFPWFADAKYWEGQVLAFKEQLATLQAPPLTLYP
ncbi:stress response serine/threonine protein kinase YihE [Salinivibrio kushneri]|uniref:serine/threonine protein kinase n=1 Tax=Salinivibrio kushneri TaxID=1908198 RepID=UPI000988730C|nr:serine/threonine protein kinase [Salinivibrio kushneri]OOE45843.1 stress response serine/threonine protein kinase YihE [Salinivibrio kushneri]